MTTSLDDRMAEALAELHQEALEAINEQRPNLYAQVEETYRTILLALPETWAKYGERFADPLAQSVDWSVRTPLDLASRHLYLEIEAALRGRSSEMAHEVLGLPYTVALRAIPLGAQALARKMLELLTLSYGLSREAPDPAVGRSAADSAITFLSEFTGFAAQRILTDDREPMANRQAAAEFMQTGFRSIAQMLKDMIDFADTASFTSLDDRWSQVIEHWAPKGQLDDWRLERLTADLAEGDPQLLSAQRTLEVGHMLDGMRQDLIDSRTLHRFLLLAWALRTAQTGDALPLREIIEYLAGHFPSPNSAVAAADTSLAAEMEDRAGVWRDWVLRDLPVGRVHSIDSSGAILTALAFMLFLQSSGNGEKPLPPRDWMRWRRDELQTAVAGAARALSKLRPEASSESIAMQASSVSRLLERTAEAQEALEAQQVRDAPLSEPLVEAYKRAVEIGWANSRVAEPLFRWLGAYAEAAADWSTVEPIGIQQRVLKDMFIADNRVFGTEIGAGELGRAVSRRETNALVNRLDENVRAAHLTQASTATIADEVAAAVRELRALTFNPTIILLPIDWRLQSALGVGRRFGRHELPSGLELGPEAAHFYCGKVGDLVAIETTSIADRLYVVDLAAFARWTEPALADGPNLVIGLTTYDSSAALKLAEDQPDLFQSADRKSAADRALEIQRFVLLDVSIRFRIDVLDERAAHRIGLTHATDSGTDSPR